MKTLAERIDAGVIRLPWSGCWIWNVSVGATGYGMLKVRGKNTATHRVSWLVHRGPIPPRALVLHRCDVRCCVNPDHLFIGSHADNSKDMVTKGRNVSPRRANGLCKRGHPLTEKPAHMGRGRYCLTCRRLRSNQKEPL